MSIEVGKEAPPDWHTIEQQGMTAGSDIMRADPEDKAAANARVHGSVAAVQQHVKRGRAAEKNVKAQIQRQHGSLLPFPVQQITNDINSAIPWIAMAILQPKGIINDFL